MESFASSSGANKLINRNRIGPLGGSKETYGSLLEVFYPHNSIIILNKLIGNITIF